jgi:archaeal cell division control protein 6
MDDILRKLVEETPRIFKDERTLTPLYVPSKIVERDDLIIEVGKNVRKLTRGQVPHHMLILGGNGSGKTVTVQYVLNQIKEAASFYYIHLHGNDEVPLYETLRNIAGECLCIVQAKDISWAAVYDQFAESLRLNGKPLMLVLDEFDYFITGAMFKLLKKLVHNEDVGIIGISNDFNVLDLINDPSVLSLFNPQRVEFPEYNGRELETILLERAKEALFPNTFDVEVIPLISVLTLQNRSGDARYALDLLKYAANNCTDGNRDRIIEKDVREAVERLELTYNISIVTRLPPQLQRLIALIIRKNEMRRSDVFELYNRKAKKDGYVQLSRTKFSLYLSTLERKGVIERINRGAGRGKGIERLVKLSPNLDIDEIRMALLEFEV